MHREGELLISLRLGIYFQSYILVYLYNHL